MKIEGRKCVQIGIPSLGRVSTRWAFNFRALAGPLNWLLPCECEQGFPVDVARNKLVVKALESKYKPSHIFWLDDDVICHPCALLQLLRAGKDIVGGVYYLKGDWGEPLILDETGCSLPYVPGSGLHKVGCVGGGLSLVSVSVYRKMMETLDLGEDDYGNPRWYYTSGDKPDENETCNEDVWFADHAAQAGFEIWCDMDAAAFGWHWDEEAGCAWPQPQWDQFLKTCSADWVISPEILEKMGRGDLCGATDETR